jgi:hypothetical protein
MESKPSSGMKAITLWLTLEQFKALREDAFVRGTGLKQLCRDRLGLPPEPTWAGDDRN